MHITLVFSLLTSSVGVVVNQHFCRDELKHTSLFTAVESCHDVSDQEDKPACPFHQKQNSPQGIADKNCCDNSSHYLKCSQEQQLEPSDLSALMLPLTVLSSQIGFIDLRQTADCLSGKYYRPPPLLTDIPIQFQVFRL